LTVTPGPREPKDLDSFLHPIMEELNILANGISGLKVHGSGAAHVLRVFLFQVTTDMPAGDKLINANGSNGMSPSRFRPLFGWCSAQHRHYYFLNLHPVTGGVFFMLQDAAAELRTIETITAAVEEIEEARRQKRTKAHVEDLCRKAGFKGYSLLLCPSQRHRAMYPNMEYFWGLGPRVAPYDVMHLILLNVVPNLWRLFSGKWKTSDGSAHKWAMSEAIVTAVGVDVVAARATVPLQQARSLRNIALHYKSYKAVDWMFFILCTGPAVLAGRIPDEAYAMFMCLVRACRVVFAPLGQTKEDIDNMDKELREFCRLFYLKAHGNDINNITLCRSTIVGLLDIKRNIMACGPTWSY